MTVLECQKIFNQILEGNINAYNLTINMKKENNFYKITKSNDDSFVVSFHPKINIDNKIILHNHDFFELAYVYKGSCINYFENEQFEMTEGNILLLNPDVKHEVRTKSPDDCLVNLIIGKNIFEKSMMTLLSDNQLMLNFFASYLYGVGKSRDYFYFYNINNSDITKLLEMIVTEYYEKNQLSQNICQSLLVALLSQLSLHYSNQEGIKLENQNDALIISILNYIQRTLY